MREPARPDDSIEHFIDLAERHGKESDPDHEIGDLQQIVRLLWANMDDGQRRRVLATEEVADFLAQFED